MDTKNKVAVIYKSKYGSTKRYAGWIAIKLDADLYELSDIIDKDLKKYETIVYGSYLHKGKIKGLNFITKNYDKIKNKNIIIFTVGLSKCNDKTIEKIADDNFDKELLKNIRLFYLKGAFDYNNLTFVDKVMTKGFKNSLENKSYNELDKWNKEFLKNFYLPMDFTNKKSVTPIVELVSSLESYKNT